MRICKACFDASQQEELDIGSSIASGKDTSHNEPSASTAATTAFLTTSLTQSAAQERQKYKKRLHHHPAEAPELLLQDLENNLPESQLDL